MIELWIVSPRSVLHMYLKCIRFWTLYQDTYIGLVPEINNDNFVYLSGSHWKRCFLLCWRNFKAVHINMIYLLFILVASTWRSSFQLQALTKSPYSQKPKVQKRNVYSLHYTIQKKLPAVCTVLSWAPFRWSVSDQCLCCVDLWALKGPKKTPTPSAHWWDPWHTAGVLLVLLSGPA